MRPTALRLTARCPACCESADVEFDLERHLLASAAARQARLLDTVHRLARAYHWSEREIPLPRGRREHISRECAEAAHERLPPASRGGPRLRRRGRRSRRARASARRRRWSSKPGSNASTRSGNRARKLARRILLRRAPGVCFRFAFDRRAGRFRVCRSHRTRCGARGLPSVAMALRPT
jgi:hypothetical protein